MSLLILSDPFDHPNKYVTGLLVAYTDLSQKREMLRKFWEAMFYHLDLRFALKLDM